MYRIFVDGNILYDPNASDEGMHISSAQLELEDNKAGSLSIVVPITNPAYTLPKKMKSTIKVEQDGQEIFRGRLLDDDVDFYLTKTLNCEGCLAFLNDSIIRPYDFTSSPKTPEQMLSYLLGQHNAQVEASRKINLGSVDVSDSGLRMPNSNSSYTTTFDAIQNELINVLGGHLVINLSGSTPVLNYVQDYVASTSSQRIELGVNLTDISNKTSGEDVCTVLIPLGATVNDSPLTIASVNGGKDYIESTTAILKYGKIWKTRTWDKITNASELLSVGQNYISTHKNEVPSIEINAVDLHLLDHSIPVIKIGDVLPIISPPHGYDGGSESLYPCTKISMDLMQPSNSTYIFGTLQSELTNEVANGSK